ncbi:MAG: flavodoxin [Leptothrix sp. (in: Bacteria)]|nr:flavodoxin [Leptothrix sp. (in: b-proteobacteria)]
MSKVVVVYFSRDGHTAAIAREIAKGLGGEIEAIEETNGRDGPLGYLRSALEALLGVAPTLASRQSRVHRGDLVVIGTPVWVWNMASPVRSYLLAHRARISRVAFFCTCGGSGGHKVLGDMRALCRRAPLARLALTEAECANRGAHKAQMAAFLRALGHGRPGEADEPQRAAHPA